MSDSYEFIDHCDAKYAYPILKMYRWLDVSRSGFYEWRDRPQSATAARRAELTVLITAIFDWSDQTYGYRRVHHEVLRRIFHSDRGSNYTSAAFGDKLDAFGIHRSVGRTGILPVNRPIARHLASRASASIGELTGIIRVRRTYQSLIGRIMFR